MGIQLPLFPDQERDRHDALDDALSKRRRERMLRDRTRPASGARRRRQPDKPFDPDEFAGEGLEEL